MRLRMSALAVAVGATVGLWGGSPASAAPANGAVIGTAANVGQELQRCTIGIIATTTTGIITGTGTGATGTGIIGTGGSEQASARIAPGVEGRTRPAFLIFDLQPVSSHRMPNRPGASMPALHTMADARLAI